MTQDEFNIFCAALPHTLHVVQWGGADVWKVGIAGKGTNKVFGIAGWNKENNTEQQRGKGGHPSVPMRRANINASRAGAEQSEAAMSDMKSIAVTFKTGEIAFEFLRDTPGCRPAPYLASRGMKWIQRITDEGVSDAELKNYLRESHRLASLNLTKKLQKELGLNQVEYFKINWHHQVLNTPVKIYYEIQADNTVMRKVERFADGKLLAEMLDISTPHESNLVNNVCHCDGGWDFNLESDEQVSVERITRLEFTSIFNSAKPKFKKENHNE